MHAVTTADFLRQPRLGHVLLDALPGTALRVSRVGGDAVVVAPGTDPRADVPLCQHRAALGRALETGLHTVYLQALGLGEGGGLVTELVTPPGVDLGGGVLARDEDDGQRRVLTVTTLCPKHASAAARAARTVPLHAHEALVRDPDRVDLSLEIARDRALAVTLLSWRHRPHPAVVGPVEDVARAAAAACAVEELLRDALASGDRAS